MKVMPREAGELRQILGAELIVQVVLDMVENPADAPDPWLTRRHCLCSVADPGTGA